MMNSHENNISHTLLSLFERQVNINPNATALVDGMTEVSFQQLDAMARRAAIHLIMSGIMPGDRVGHCFKRSIEAIAAIIAIHKVGAAYVPIATDAPSQRRDFILQDSEAKIVICGEDISASFEQCCIKVVPWTLIANTKHEVVESNHVAKISPTSIAWVLYTSGSSGQPKGVLGTHKGCVTRLQATWKHQPFVVNERCFQHTAFTTVDSFWEIFAPLCAGHALHIVEDELIKDPERLLPHLAALQIRRICMVPSLLALLIDLYPSLQAVVPNLKIWVVSGEPLTLDLCIRFRHSTRDAQLFNQYGLTESCADITSYDASNENSTPVSGNFETCLYAPIGRPFEGTQLFIVDEEKLPVPDGIAGELCIAGDSLSDGYLNQPELMEARFFTLPSEGTRDSQPALRTGDRAVRLDDGNLLYLGRIDSQINLRGYRIEPGEVEAAIATHQDVVQAAVVLHEEDAFYKQLVAYVTLRPKGQFSLLQDASTELKRHTESILPSYMLPGTFVVLDAMPLTPTGKIDRRKLTTIDRPVPITFGKEDVEGKTESVVAAVFIAILKLEKVGATDNFFDIGGNSLLAMRVVSTLRARIGANLPMHLIFKNSTVRSLAKCIDDIQENNKESEDWIRLRPIDAAQIMSYGQERMWFFEKLNPGTATYTISWNLRMRGELDKNALIRALEEIVLRHDVLRTHFIEHDGIGLQVIQPESAVTLHTRSVSERELNVYLDECSNLSFNLEMGPLYYFTLFELSPKDHCLSVAVHHAVFDGWSVQVMGEELCTLYTAFTKGLASPLAPLTTQFIDYAYWQREWLDDNRVKDLEHYWRKQLSDAPTVLELPTDRVRPSVASYRGAHVPYSITADRSQALRELARREGATLYMVLLAALNVVLSRWSGQKDIVVGSPIVNRNHRETETMLGFFANTLALRTDITDDPPFSALLQRVRQTALGAYEHQDLPFDKLVEMLQPARDLSRQAVFQVMFALHPEQTALVMPKLQLDAWEGQSASAKFDLTLELVDAVSGIHGTFEFASDLWDRETIERLTRHFDNILGAIAQNPSLQISELPLMDRAEIDTLLQTEHKHYEPYSQDQSVAALFEAQVAISPQATALSFNGITLNYAELDSRADKLAVFLQNLGVGPDVLVGVCLPRCIDMVVSLLAITKAGGAYLPIDPGYPADRISYMLSDSDVSVLITHAQIATHLPKNSASYVLIDEEWPQIVDQRGSYSPKTVEASHLAYVIYTSGTTGRPKGVMVQQQGLNNLMQWFVKDIGMCADDAVLLVSSHSFDLTQKNIFGPLIAGGVLHLSDEPFDPLVILKQVQREGCNFINCTPSAFYALIESDEGMQLSSLQRVMLGGEPIQVAKLMQMSEPRPQFINSYGPTECSDVDVVHSMSDMLQSYRSGVPLGNAVRNMQLYVLDDNYQLVPQGAVGELYIAGVGLARGYLNRPDLTAERFVPNPFGSGSRMYKTGDLVRWNSQWRLEYLGRIDHQVKLRGFRIETGEIEAALLTSPQVDQALVLACDDHRSQLQLVAYIVGNESLHDESSLRNHLKAKLPEPMIPSSYVWLDKMPLSPNGKVDRKSLPAPALPSFKSKYVAPRSELEQSVASIFAEMLQVDKVGLDDNFFHLGGHSLLAMRVVTSIRKILSRELPLRDFFDNPTVSLLAQRIESIVKIDSAPILAVPSSNRQSPLPLSFAQERLWFLERLGIGGITYNVPWVLQLDGDLDVPALERAITEVLNRHESLRTRFQDRNGKPEQLIDLPDVFSLPVQLISDERLGELLQTLAEHCFDLAKGPLCKFNLYQTNKKTFHLSFVAHHIICDGWSIDIMADELVTLYKAFVQGLSSPLQPLKVQYADYASWQRRKFNNKRFHEQLAYWEEKLRGAPAVLNLPTDYPRPSAASYRGGHVPFSLSVEATTALSELAHREDVTLYMVLLAAFNVVLSRWSGQNDIVVGSPIAGRTQRETEPMIGFFVNTLALRTELTNELSFSSLLQRVRSTTLDAYAHQELPFEKLVEALQPVRDLSHQAVFQVMLALHISPQSQTLPGLLLKAKEGRTPTAKFDLSIEATLNQGMLQGNIEYASDLFNSTTMQRFADHYLQVLEHITRQPECPIGEISMLRPDERKQQLVDWNSTRIDYPDAQEALHKLIERQVQCSPHSVALMYEGDKLSYDELNRRANQLAHYLRLQGIGTDSFVALCMHRSPQMVVALLGILKAGAAYVPIDPTHPHQRIEFMLTDTASALLLTQKDVFEQLGDLRLPVLCLDNDAEVLSAQPQHNLPLAFHPDQLAYCIYTSGSTGQPKGAMNSHRAIVNRLLWMQAQYQLTANDTVLQKTPYSFDVSVWEFFWPLMTGARLAIARPEGHKDPNYLAQAIRHYKVTTAHFVPAMLQVFLAQHYEALPTLRRVFASGEALAPSVQQKFREQYPLVELHNLYGPTEAAVDVSFWPCVDDFETVPIGYPVSNTQLYLLDQELQPVPLGSSAEIYIAGVQLARGYLHKPDLTAEKFIPNPYGEPGSRMYRTGDLGRYRPDGAIEYLGRTDHQVKLRGLRIELGEIENTLLSLADVREAAVLVRQVSGQAQLVAYVALYEPTLSNSDLQEKLRNQLPDYMIPTAWVLLSTLPLNSNGKIDRKALPEPKDLGQNAVHIEPVSDSQKLLASLWEDLFKVERVGLNDDFFSLGGHSLLAVQTLYLLKQRTGVEIQVREFFEASTVGMLASIIDARLQEKQPV
ncbi:non-ribosomal peptide synthetase [Dickeya chrysanthemi]|uniref:non-ribosomal peptide synthetase n=1 Tax=Dickeya chrysanthemi TaxID=556 RepID=UPI001CF16F6A|nr:non-ribosomal peptide synthetase [Dickeya chrysanthemi]MCA7006955.1 amino acid adenylation domain-containing protein [Dickeya chrysanthemi]